MILLLASSADRAISRNLGPIFCHPCTVSTLVVEYLGWVDIDLDV